MHLDPRRILIIKPSSLGDVVHALPVPHLLRERWPAAHITWLVNDNFAELLEGHAALDQVLVFDRRRYANAWRNPLTALALTRFCDELAAQKYDLVIDLQGLFRSGWMSYRTGAPVRIGLSDARELASLFYTDVIHSDRLSEHAVDRYVYVARRLGCHGPVRFEFPSADKYRDWARQTVGGIGKYAVVMPATNWPTKRWPAQRFGQLLEPLKTRLGLATVLAGGPDAQGLANQIPADLDLAGKTTVGQLVALLAGASLVVANDSGPMHIASALNRPLVALFGPTDPLLTGPWGRLDSVVRLDIACAPCLSRRCSHRSCLEWLETRDVMEAAHRQINVAV